VKKQSKERLYTRSTAVLLTELHDEKQKKSTTDCSMYFSS